MVRYSKATSGWLALLCLVASLCGSNASREHDKCFLLRLKDRNIDAVAAAAEEIASIDSSKAGKWLSAEDVAELSGRSQVEVNQLKTFVESHSGRLEQVSPTRDMALACFPPHAQVLGGAGPKPSMPAVSSTGPIAANSTTPVASNVSKPAEAKDVGLVKANSSAPAHVEAPKPKVQPVNTKSSAPAVLNKPTVVSTNSSEPAAAIPAKFVSGNSSAPAAATPAKPVDSKTSAPAATNTVASGNSSTPAATKPAVVSGNSSAPAATTPAKTVDSKSPAPAATTKPAVASTNSSTPAAPTKPAQAVSGNSTAPTLTKPAVVSTNSPTPAAATKPAVVSSNNSAPAAATKTAVVSNSSSTPAQATKPAVGSSNGSAPAAAAKPKLEKGISPLSSEAHSARMLVAVEPATPASDPSLVAANNTRLVEATRKAVQAHAPSATLMGAAAVSAAEKLATALPAALADITEVVLPVPGLRSAVSTTTSSSSSSGGGSGKYTSGPILRTPGWGSGAPGEGPASTGRGAAVGGAGNYTSPTTSTIAGINVSSPYGVPLPQPMGYFAGYTDPATNVSYAIPQFTTDTLLFALGASDAATILKNINESPILLMLPCSLEADDQDALQGVVFATVEKEKKHTCAGQLNITWSETYADGTYSPGPRKSVTYTPEPIGTCADAVRRSNGMLPFNTCEQIAAQYTEFTGVPSDISAETVLYWYSPLATDVTTYVGLKDLDVSLTLSSGVQEPFRNFGRVHYASYDAMILAGTNTPAEWRGIYNVPHYASNAGAGLMASPAGFTPQADYNFSPYDLATASRAFSYSVPSIASVTNTPLFPANNPTAVYAAESGGKGEAALDIQMVTEYGAGSGAKFGFVAASSDSDRRSPGFLSNFLGYMGLRPLPDVLSLSWGSAQPAPPGAEEIETVIASNAILAKLAAMGVTVVASSGDYGNYGISTATCDSPFAPQAPAGSPWVTSVGAVQQACTSPDAPPQLVGAISPLGTPLTSAGGFSYVAEAQTPKWQAKCVKHYIHSQQSLPSWPFAPQNAATTGASYSIKCMAANPGSGGGNCVYGRGYPDVSLSGVYMPVQLAGVPQAISGTSASAPAFAGLVLHLNAAVRATPGLGHCKLGFLNPFLYWAAEHYPDAFTDITVGGTGFAPDGTPCSASFNAAPGWDAFTGLGVPNIKVLSKAAVEWVSRQEGLWHNNKHYYSRGRRDAAERDEGTGPNRDRYSGPDYRAGRGYDRRAGYREQDSQEGLDRSPGSSRRPEYDAGDNNGPHSSRREYTGPNVRAGQDPDRRNSDSMDSQLDLILGGDPREQQQLWQDFEGDSQHGGYTGDGSSSRGPNRETVRDDPEGEDHHGMYDSSRYEGYKRRSPEGDADEYIEGGHHGRRGHDDDQYEPRDHGYDRDNRDMRQHRQHDNDYDRDDQHARDINKYEGSDRRENRDTSYPGPTQRDGQQRRYTPYDAETPLGDATGSYDVHGRRGSGSRHHRRGDDVEYDGPVDRRDRRGDAYEGSKVHSDRYTVRPEPKLDRRQAGEKSLEGSRGSQNPGYSKPAHQGEYQHRDEYHSGEEVRGAGRRGEGGQGGAGHGYTRDEDRPGYLLNGHGDRRQRAEGSQA